MLSPQSKSTLSPAQEQAQILAVLDRILVSHVFCNSKQSERLLRYLVKYSLENRTELLRERVIGVDLFGRDPGYDTNEASIVRVRINELRKRLAQYYQDIEPSPEVRFTIPHGSYRVEFHRPLEALEPAPPVPEAVAEIPHEEPARSRMRAAVILAAAFCALLAAAVFFWPASALDRFWRPALSGSRPVLLCSPHPVLYRFTQEFQKRATGSSSGHGQNQMEALQLVPGTPLAWRDVVTIKDQYIGVGTAHAIAAISGLLAVKHQATVMRFGNDVSFQDFRNSPTVLTGAFSNHWTLEMTADWRFVFAEKDGQPIIIDRKTGTVWKLPALEPNGRTREDYALVSRVFRSQTGQVLIEAAGITQYGTRSAGEFLTNPELMRQAFQFAPRDWDRRNIQVLLHANIVGQIPGPPKVVALHLW